MTLTKFQKKIIKKIIKFNPQQIDYSLKILIEEILETFFKGIGIKILTYKIIIYIDNDKCSTEKILSERKKVYEFITLIDFLLKEKYLECVEAPFIENFNYAISEKEISNKNKCIIPIGEKIVNNVYSNLNSYFYISPLLNEFKRNFYTDLERINLKYTLIAISSSIFISIVGIITQFYTAKNVDTTVVFREKKDLEKILNLKEINIENKIVLYENFYRPKTNLKLRIFNEKDNQ